MKKILSGLLLGPTIAASAVQAQTGPLRLEITEGVIEPSPISTRPCAMRIGRRSTLRH